MVGLHGDELSGYKAEVGRILDLKLKMFREFGKRDGLAKTGCKDLASRHF
jgi:hypothetical protein